jgi:hypothetical protein
MKANQALGSFGRVEISSLHRRIAWTPLVIPPSRCLRTDAGLLVSLWFAAALLAVVRRRWQRSFFDYFSHQFISISAINVFRHHYPFYCCSVPYTSCHAPPTVQVIRLQSFQTFVSHVWVTGEAVLAASSQTSSHSSTRHD